MDKTSSVSFGFKATSDSGLLKSKSAIIDDDATGILEETDYVKSVDGTNITSVKAKPLAKNQPLVIPLIQQNNWRNDSSSSSSSLNKSDRTKTTDTSEVESTEKDDLTKLAAKELIEAAKRSREGHSNGEEDVGSSMSIPLLLQNKVCPNIYLLI